MMTANEKHRVLIVGPVSETGGMAVVARQTADAERLPGWNIQVVDTARSTPPGRSTLRALWAHARRFRHLLKTLLRHRPHVAHIHTCSYNTFFRTMPDILACRLFGSKVALHIHGGFFADFLEALAPPMGCLVRFCLRRCHRVIVLGQVWRSRLNSLVPGLPLDVVPNAVETPKTLSRRHRRRRRGNRILFVGDLARTKGPDDLIEAVSMFPDSLRRTVRVRLAGGGAADRRDELYRLARERGVQDRVILLGPMDRDNVRREYEEADVFCLSSHGEGMPISLLEAMAAGLPSVATDVGAVREVLRDGTEGFVVARSDPGALADRLRLLLGDSGLREAMGARAATRASTTFAAAAFQRRIDQVWRSLVLAAPRETADPVGRGHRLRKLPT